MVESSFQNDLTSMGPIRFMYGIFTPQKSGMNGASKQLQKDLDFHLGLG